MVSMRTQVESLASLSGLRIGRCCKLQLGSGIAVAVILAGSYSSDWTSSLGTSILCGCGPKKDKKIYIYCQGSYLYLIIFSFNVQCTLINVVEHHMNKLNIIYPLWSSLRSETITEHFSFKWSSFKYLFQLLLEAVRLKIPSRSHSFWLMH